MFRCQPARGARRLRQAGRAGQASKIRIPRSYTSVGSFARKAPRLRDYSAARHTLLATPANRVPATNNKQRSGCRSLLVAAYLEDVMPLAEAVGPRRAYSLVGADRKSTRLNSS